MGLQIWLPLDGNINNQGLSDVKIYGAPTSWQEGKIGKCAKFNGDYKTIYTETTHEFDYTDNFSWACWVLPVHSGTTYQYIFSVGRVDYGSYGYGARLVSATKINIRYGSAEWSISCEASKWIHIAFVKQDKNIRIYKNGNLYESTTYDGITPTYTESIGLTLGCFRYNVGTIYPSFCSINDFRLYNTSLTDRQVKEISKGLVCHYPLGEIDGKIGGRNLLQHSSLVGEQLICYKIDTMNSVTTKSYEKEGYHIVTPSTGNGNNGVGFKYTDFTSLGIKQGDTITFSCDIKGTSDTHSPFIKIHFSAKAASYIWYGVDSVNSVGVGFIPLKNKWQRISVAFTIPDTSEWTGNNMWLAIHGNFESDLYIKNLKLEKSSTATPWTPAPEDDSSFYDNVIYDTSGYNNNGSVTDSTYPTWSSDTPRHKGSYMFNGNKQFLKFQNPISSAFAEFSISCWVKFTNVTNETNDAICTMRSGVGTGVALFRIRNNFRFDDNAFTTFSEYVIPQNTWLHIVVTRSLSCKKLYINGILKQTTNTVGDMKLISNVGTIGASSQKGDNLSNYLNGQLSDFRIYATELDNKTIEELYKIGASLDSNGNLMLAGEVIEE